MCQVEITINYTRNKPRHAFIILLFYLAFSTDITALADGQVSTKAASLRHTCMSINLALSSCVYKNSFKNTLSNSPVTLPADPLKHWHLLCDILMMLLARKGENNG